ncbi:MAG: efflux RND transporter periplasmic adaptor subunit [Burkholderiales bacterium]|nr:efflux RND transporter periplasmic adaptor subunit [Burkholderiales bacterium]
MTSRRLTFIAAALLAAVLLGTAGWGLYTAGVQHGRGAATSAASVTSGGLVAGDIDPANGKHILYYHDPMVPASRFDKPGKSPFMDMPLVPVYADDRGTDSGNGNHSGVRVSPRMRESLGVRTAPVVEGSLAPEVAAVGSIAFDEREQAVVQARAGGWIERLHVRATLDRVAAGQPLVDLYVPDWIAAQEDYLALRRMPGPDLAPLVDAARQRMLQAGMSADQVALVERSGRTQPRITLRAPIGGVVVELQARQGMTVMPGTPLFRINGLATVWADAQVPESQAGLLRPGARVQATSPSAPGRTFSGRVQAILPAVDPRTRTLTARMVLANPGHQLAPGMYVQMRLAGAGTGPALLVPSEAVIRTGRRAVVVLATGDGHFRPVQVQTGLDSGGRTQILSGLQAGQRVVASGQFLIDSEASLRGVETWMQGASAPADANGAASNAGAGGRP